MSLATIPQAAMDAVLLILAPFLLQATGGDLTAARQAARLMLADYDVESQEELRLATEVLSFSFQLLQALSQAADADIAISRQLRLRSGAVNLRRSEKLAQDKLDQLQRARRAGLAEPAPAPHPPAPAPASAPDAAPAPDQPSMNETLELLKLARTIVDASARPPGSQPPANQPPANQPRVNQPPVKNTPRALRLAAEKQRMVQRMAENARRRADEYQRQEAAKAQNAAAQYAAAQPVAAPA